jgi:CxxC motif-containing protein (DUF1111 family)
MRAIVSAAVVFLAVLVSAPGMLSQSGPTEAPAGFDLAGNGFLEEFCANQAQLTDSPNSPEIPDGRNDPEDECEPEPAEEEFTGPEAIADGLGPIFNAAGCGECHLVPILGGGSQITEKRAGRFLNNIFTEHPGGSLIQDRANSGATQELVFAGHNVVAQRASIPVLGIGFVEAISNTTLTNLRNAQPSAQRGTLINVPVFERPGTTRFGRFGWKAQQASLVSFSADAYVNEMGITSPLQPDEPTSNGTVVIDPVPGIDDAGVDVELFALFMRNSKVPPRGPINSDVSAGSTLFNQVGCNVCHTRDFVTASPGTLINGGALRVANALGNKIIHPFSDFMLHDVGTGDGIVQNGGASTRNQIRTPALWGLRARGRFMHDALTFSLTDAINRHGNQGATARNAFNALSTTNKNRLLAFLLSL